MSQLLALEWDQFEARIVIASRKAAGVVIEHAFVVSLAPRAAGETFVDASVGERVTAALAARGSGRVETIVAVGRSNIELRRLSLPLVPEDELPEIVRFQALPQFSNLSDDWALDYFKLASTGEGQSVLAAAISPQLIEQIKSTCQAAGLAPSRLILRPCAAASLLVQRGGPAAQRIRLLVDLLGEEADLTVLVERDIVLMRTVRLPATNASEQAGALIGEIRRTIAAAQNQLGGQRVEAVVLCGVEVEQRELAQQIGDKLSLPVASFDPLAGLAQSDELRAHPPAQRGRFAPLVGMVLDEAAGRPHLIDFLNPRRRPAPPSRRRVCALAGAVAALLLLSLLAAAWLQLASLKNRRDELSQQSLNLDEDVQQALQLQAQVATIDIWKASSVDWLAELCALSSPAKFSAAEDALLNEWKTTSRTTGGGQMTLVGRARASSVIPQMEELLRDELHTVKSGPSVSDEEDARYPWRFEETVDIAPADAKQLAAAQAILKAARGRGR